MKLLRKRAAQAFCASLALATAAAVAQSSGGAYRVDPATTAAAGGGTASGASYRLSGTFGQAATTRLSGSAYSMQDGIWASAAAQGDSIFANGFEL